MVTACPIKRACFFVSSVASTERNVEALETPVSAA